MVPKRWKYAGKQPPDAKPCPFCAGTDLYVEHGDCDATFVKCNDCYTAGPSVIEAWTDDDNDCEPQAWEKWNGRVNGNATEQLKGSLSRVVQDVTFMVECKVIPNVLDDIIYVEARRLLGVEKV